MDILLGYTTVHRKWRIKYGGTMAVREIKAVYMGTGNGPASKVPKKLFLRKYVQGRVYQKRHSLL